MSGNTTSWYWRFEWMDDQQFVLSHEAAKGPFMQCNITAWPGFRSVNHIYVPQSVYSWLMSALNDSLQDSLQTYYWWKRTGASRVGVQRWKLLQHGVLWLYYPWLSALSLNRARLCVKCFSRRPGCPMLKRTLFDLLTSCDLLALLNMIRWHETTFAQVVTNNNCSHNFRRYARAVRYHD